MLSLVEEPFPWLPAVLTFSNNLLPKSLSFRFRSCIKPFKSGRLSISDLNAASALANLFFLRNSSMASTFESAISELQ
ncbi:hypothetical protein HanRHA438_Chr12g0551041 [Helianthus annuus]|nr:hypothetical protein HanRHA438_Chr12g0551041 [Helianthus annuus]